MEPPGAKVTMVTCMSWRTSSGSTKRVVAQAPSVSGIGVGAMSCSLVKNASGTSMPSTRWYRLRIHWKAAVSPPWLRSVHAAPGGRKA